MSHLSRASGGHLLRATGGHLSFCAVYMQAKKCTDDSNVDLWRLKSSLTLPYYFKLGGVCYYFATGNTESGTPGTILTGETSQSSCGGCIQACSNCSVTPKQWLITISGTTLCTDCVNQSLGDGANSYKYSGSLNGTYTAKQEIVRADGFDGGTVACLWYVLITGCIQTAYSGSNCTGSVIYAYPVGLELFVSGGSTTVSIVAFAGTIGGQLFAGSTSTNCGSTRTFTNTATCGTQGANSAGAFGGSMTGTPAP